MGRKPKYVLHPDVKAKYSGWTVIDGDCKKDGKAGVYWRVRCDCGFEALRPAWKIAKGESRSCGRCNAKEKSFQESIPVREVVLKRISRMQGEKIMGISRPYTPIRLNDVISITGIGKSKIYLMMKKASPDYDETFPLPVKMGKKMRRWKAEEVVAWMESLPRGEY